MSGWPTTRPEPQKRITRETLIKLSLFTASRDRVAPDGNRDEAEDPGDDDGL